jgi:hypothetical protein
MHYIRFYYYYYFLLYPDMFRRFSRHPQGVYQSF